MVQGQTSTQTGLDLSLRCELYVFRKRPSQEQPQIGAVGILDDTRSCSSNCLLQITTVDQKIDCVFTPAYIGRKLVRCAGDDRTRFNKPLLLNENFHPGAINAGVLRVTHARLLEFLQG